MLISKDKPCGNILRFFATLFINVFREVSSFLNKKC